MRDKDSVKLYLCNEMSYNTQNIEIETPGNWPDYELLDSGNGFKLERFGKHILIRPEPKALWSKSLQDKEWYDRAHTIFKPGAGFGKAGKEDSGTWEQLKKMPEQWNIKYTGAGKLHLNLRLGLTAFKHVGVFPEQATNWDWIYSQSLKIASNLHRDTNSQQHPKVLNIFAYTGGATLAARCAGAEVTHVDSVKQVVNWAKENMAQSGLDNIRWIVDDAFKFVKREARRGNLYNGLILDPPAYGHGPNGERWKLDELLFQLLQECSKIVAPQNSFVVLNLYSNGYSALLAKTALEKAFGKDGNYSCGELVLSDSFGKHIPLSVFARLVR